MKKLSVIVKSRMGLHARPASMLVSLAQQFESDIKVEKGEKVVNCKSIIGILSIAAKNGDKISVSAEGADEISAINALDELFNNRLAAE
ncbi:MAG TPA: HPr family phosphocarrier protein [Bacillota bacterium]|nr:HPr family phosphocarrier protein [Bacillota bacterium]